MFDQSSFKLDLLQACLRGTRFYEEKKKNTDIYTITQQTLYPKKNNPLHGAFVIIFIIMKIV